MSAIEIARSLVKIDSVTSASNQQANDWLSAALERIGFEVECATYYDNHGVGKYLLTARRLPTSNRTEPGGIGYFCHTDVVSVEGWECPYGGAFDAVVDQQRLWGRGACDMKGSIAAALAACELVERAEQVHPIYFFATGDEECGMQGAREIASNSSYFSEMVASQAVGVIGEPTQLRVVNAHKGGCFLDVTSSGVAAHSSTIDGLNANWQMVPFFSFIHDLAKRCETEPALQNQAFTPATMSMNMVIENEPAAANITVGKTTCRLFFRPMPNVPWEALLSEILEEADRLDLQVRSLPPLPPLLTPENRPFVQTVLELLDQPQADAVCYATDGCCLGDLQNMILLGPGSIEQAHRADEWIDLEQLEKGTQVYARLFRKFTC